MRKQEFLTELRTKLSGLSENDLEERLAFYEEKIEQSVEGGISEEEAVARLGTVDEIVAQIMSEIPLGRLVRQKMQPQKSVQTWKVVLLILGFPIWFPLLVTVFAVVLSMYIVLWALELSFLAVVIAFAAGILFCMLGVVLFCMEHSPAGAGFMIGGGFICAGLGLLMLSLCGLVFKAILKITQAFLLWIKSWFVGKEGKKYA